MRASGPSCIGRFVRGLTVDESSIMVRLMLCFADIANRFASRARLAELGPWSLDQVHKWCTRGSSNGIYDLELIRVAEAEGVALTLEELVRCRIEGPAEMRRRRRERADAQEAAG